jgi:hypothetical protein
VSLVAISLMRDILLLSQQLVDDDLELPGHWQFFANGKATEVAFI